MTAILQRLMFLTLTLSLALSALALWIGTLLLPTRTAADLTFDFCELPCWAGITVNETRFDQAEAIFTEQFAANSLTMNNFQLGFNFHFIVDEQPITGSLARSFDSYDVVSELYFRSAVSLAPIMEQFGTPDCVITNPYLSTVSLYWRENTNYYATFIAADSDHWNIRSSPSAFGIVIYSLCDLAESRPWIGLAPIWRYQQIAPLNGTGD